MVLENENPGRFEQNDEDDRLKLEVLRRLAADAFDAIDRGEYVTIAPGQLGAFMHRASRKARAEQ